MQVTPVDAMFSWQLSSVLHVMKQGVTKCVAMCLSSGRAD